MKIVILTGGTGSIALQQGIFEQLDSKVEGVDVKIITNAYDNGLSTGAVRKVLGGKILGPSDVRKNQTTRLKLQEPTSPWNKFLDIRFTAEASKAKAFCYEKIDALELELRLAKHPSTNEVYSVKDAIDFFFSAPAALSIDYNDFSLANIIYAGFARAFGNSLRDAARQMARVLGIKDNVLLNSDESLFLGAISKSGKRVTDEGDIVSWGKMDDPFVDIFFTDVNGHETTPVLCDEAKEALLEADLIILSSGTQWSSLIPTYASIGFKETMEQVTGKVIMVMNRQADNDSPSQTADDIINILVPKYFAPGQLHVSFSSTAHPDMNTISKETVALIGSAHTAFEPCMTETSRNSKKHDPKSLFESIAELYFGDYLKSSHFFFDYDDTLVARGNKFPKTASMNIALINVLASNNKNVYICTGNSIKAINLYSQTSNHGYFLEERAKIPVFADGGINVYECVGTANQTSYKWTGCIKNDLVLDSGNTKVDDIIEVLLSLGISPAKIDNRGNVMISIKPVDIEYRQIVINLLEQTFKLRGMDLIARAAGRSTIEIFKPEMESAKQFAVKFTLLDKDVKMITYVGDELESGNDASVAELQQDYNVKCLPVNDPAKTAFFLIALTKNIIYGVM